MNKKLSLIFVVFFITLSSDIVYSQVENTIVDTNSVWSIYKELVVAEPIPTNYYIHLKGDTLIDSKHYTKIWTNNDLYPTDNMKFEGFIREENQKTYFRYFGYPESIIYDFSLSVGDSINFNDHWFANIMIDSVEINGNKYKQMKLSNRYDTISLIEKIGNIEEGLLYTLKIYYVGVMENLLCYYNKNNCLYTNPEFNYCSLSLDNPIKMEDDDKTIIYPNPVKNYLNIDSKEIISKIEILDIEGRLLMCEDTINNSNYRINLYSLGAGSYVLKIVYINGQNGSYKLIKQ